VALHAWGRPGKATTPSGFTTTYLEDYLVNQPIAQAQLLSFVSEGVFERFLDLRVMVTECGFAWLPPLLWRFDKDWKGAWARGAVGLELCHRAQGVLLCAASLIVSRLGPRDDRPAASRAGAGGGPALLGLSSGS
jgi:hypothetical protein